MCTHIKCMKCNKLVCCNNVQTISSKNYHMFYKPSIETRGNHIKVLGIGYLGDSSIVNTYINMYCTLNKTFQMRKLLIILEAVMKK